jgi:hypothetical protein
MTEEIQPYIPPARKEIIDNLMIDALDDSAGKDFDFARANLKEVIEKGSLSLDNLAMLAERSQHPRAYEVLAKTIDSLVNANEKLLDLQLKIRQVKDVSAKVNGGNKTVNQTAIFVGSTAELQRNLKKTLKNMNMIEEEEKDEPKKATKNRKTG